LRALSAASLCAQLGFGAVAHPADRAEHDGDRDQRRDEQALPAQHLARPRDQPARGPRLVGHAPLPLGVELGDRGEVRPELA
jgi:hypothetical protein